MTALEVAEARLAKASKKRSLGSLERKPALRRGAYSENVHPLTEDIRIVTPSEVNPSVMRKVNLLKKSLSLSQKDFFEVEKLILSKL